MSDLLASVSNVDAVGTTTITYNGVPHSLLAVAGIEDREAGYSASPGLSELQTTPSGVQAEGRDLAAAGVMIGEPDPVMLFPGATVFSAYAFLQNLTQKPLDVTVLATQPDGSKVTVTSLVVPANGGVQADLSKLASLLNATRYTNLVFHYVGHLGDLNVDAGSIDQTRNYVFEVGVGAESQSISRTICYWTISGDTDTMMSIWNFTNQPQDELLTLYFSGGLYKIPFHLAPGATKTLTLHEIQRSQMPDSEGNPLPENIVEGSALLSAAAGEFAPMSVAVATASFNLRNGTCGQNCMTCNGVTDMAVNPYPIGMAVGGQAQATATVTYNTGSPWTTTTGTWSSSSSTVARVSSSGMVSAQSPGTSNITDYLGYLYVDAGYVCMGYNLYNCPTSPTQAGSPANVQIPASTANGPNVYSQPSTACPVFQGKQEAGWDRLVNKYLLDQNGGLFLPTTAWAENLVVDLSRDQLGLNGHLKQGPAPTNGGGFQDQLQFCSTACPGPATTYIQQNQTDTYNGTTYPLTPNQFMYSCKGNTINGN